MILDTTLGLDTIALRLFAALMFGGLLGLEREVRGKPAGLRTHMLVSLAAAAFTLQTIEITRAQMWGAVGTIDPDPMRLVQAIVAGVAFLGAGAIIQSGSDVRGLTTGAGIWTAGSVGLACGMGQLGFAAVLAAMAVGVLWLVGAAEHALGSGES